MMFKGSMVALITPMHPDGSIDKKALCELVEWHIAAQTDALIIAGTTGESATLEAHEQQEIVSLVVKQVAGRIPVIAGSGTNATRTTLALSKQAELAGADGCLIVTPYYNKPPQNGLYEHYKHIAENINIPVLLYNVPGRTGCDLQPETVARLATIKNIIGIKEATGNLDRAKAIAAVCDASFGLYSGDDATAMDFILQGGHGVISVTANVAPALMKQLCDAALRQDRAAAQIIQDTLMPLHKELFIESNPIPTKWVLEQMGKIGTGLRLPLINLDSKYHETVRLAMQQAGIN